MATEEVKGIEARIMERTKREVEREVQNAFRAVDVLKAEANWPSIMIVDKTDDTKNIRVDVHGVLISIQARLVQALLPKRYEQALSEFLNSVDRLQSQIDDLRDDVTGGRS